MRAVIENKSLLLSNKCIKQMLNKPEEMQKLKKIVNEIKNNDYQNLEIDYIYYGFDGIFITNDHQILSYNDIREMVR